MGYTTSKVCTKCGSPGPFQKDRSKKDGLSCRCNRCKKEYYTVNRERCLARSRIWRKTNPEKVRTESKAYREANPGKVRARIKSYRSSHKQLLLGIQHREYKKGRAFIDSLKDSPCVDCKQRYPSHCMDFDHVKGVKRSNLSRMVHHSQKSILEEVSKCDLVCANCHRVRTVARQRRSKNLRRAAFNERISNLKRAPCIDCGKTFPSEAMEFDHVRGEKLCDIASMHDSPWAKVLHEINKCDLVCSCCHRERTWSQRKGSPSIAKETLERRRRVASRNARINTFKEQSVGLLGMISDRRLAKRFQVDPSVVALHRRKLGIQSYHQSKNQG